MPHISFNKILKLKKSISLERKSKSLQSALSRQIPKTIISTTYDHFYTKNDLKLEIPGKKLKLLEFEKVFTPYSFQYNFKIQK